MSFARFKKVIFGEKEVKTSVTKTAPVKKITTVDEHLLAIEEMTRSEIFEYAKELDIHLDQRKRKDNMIGDFIQKLKEKN
jgi:hypothetical protein